LRIGLGKPTGARSTFARDYQLKAPVVVENKRDVFAWIKAERSCLVDPEQGTTNLLWRDACLPAKCWTKISGLAPGFVTIYWNPSFFLMEGRDPRPTGGAQRVLLNVVWEDDKSESVDLSYEIKATYPESS